MTIEQTVHKSPVPEKLDSQTYEAFVSPHLSQLKRWVASRSPKGVNSDDVMQQTLLLALRHVGQFRFEASMGTWLCSIALNVIRARLRSLQSSRVVYKDPLKIAVLGIVDPCRSPLDKLEQREEETILHRAIARLPAMYRTVIELRDLRGLNIEETMESLSISKTAVKSRHYRARRMLLGILKDRGNELQ